MSKVISVFSTKGGVGKSTICSYLALTIAQLHPEKKVLIIDLCQNSSVGEEFGSDRDFLSHTTLDWYTGRAKASQVIKRFADINLYYMPSAEDIDDMVRWTEKNYKIGREKKLSEKIEPLKKVFDYIFIDNHPSENDQKVIYSLVASDIVLLPLDIAKKSARALLRDFNIYSEINAAYGLDYLIVPNRVETNKGDLKELENIKKECVKKGINPSHFSSYIRYSSAIKRGEIADMIRDKRITNKYITNVMEDFVNVSKEVMNRVEAKVKS